MNEDREQLVARQVHVVLEKSPIDNPWVDWLWRAQAILLDADAGDDWRVLHQGGGVTHYLSPAQQIELHRKDTPGYVENLNSRWPSVYVVLNEDEESDEEVPFDVHLVTVNAYEAQDYMDSSESLVERIAMDEVLGSWVEAFCRRHHREEVFKKRRRDKVDVAEHKFGQEPLAELRRRGAIAGREGE